MICLLKGTEVHPCSTQLLSEGMLTLGTCDCTSAAKPAREAASSSLVSCWEHREEGMWSSAPPWTPAHGWGVTGTKRPQRPPGLSVQGEPSLQMDSAQEPALSRPGVLWGMIKPKKEKTSSPQMAGAEVWSVSLVPQWYLIAAQMFTWILPLKPKVFMHSGKQTREQAMQWTPFAEHNRNLARPAQRSRTVMGITSSHLTAVGNG